MTDTNKQFEILLGLLANQQAEQNSAPSEETLAAWFDHKLQGNEKRAVEAWLAQSDEGIEALSALMDAQESGVLDQAAAQPSPTKAGIVESIKHWWLVGGTLVFACVLGVAVMLPIIQSPNMGTRIDEGYGDLLALSGGQYAENWPYTVSKAFDPFATKARKDKFNIAFTEGVVQGIKQSGATSEFWQRVVKALGKEAVDCQNTSDAQSCITQTNLLRNLGRWSLMNHLVCEQVSMMREGFGDRQVESAAEFAKLLQDYEGTDSYLRYLRALKTEQSQNSRCETISALMSYGLGQ